MKDSFDNGENSPLSVPHYRGKWRRVDNPFEKGDLVLIEHKKLVNDRACSHKPSDRYKMTAGRFHSYSLAMVLDAKPKISYVIYVAGKGSEVKFDPFWIDNECLIPYGGSHESGRHHGGHESPTE